MKSNDLTPSSRNLQLDFFRGLALMIIFINHMPFNPWFAYTPSRLGPSDAAETFVFLSGFAAAIAFGRSFQQAGLALGSVRVLFRCAQIYLAHIVLFLLMSVLLVTVVAFNADGAKWQLDNLHYFFEHTDEALLALVSLKYVPNFIDILPMYLVIMLWLPMVWALSRVHVALALMFSVALYACAHYFGWELTADPVTGKAWYFNPFCWQLVFFTGFAFSSGWLPIPRFNPALATICLAYAIFCYPLENAYGYSRLPWFAAFREQWEPLLNKGHLGVLRYLHFLAMVYLISNLARKYSAFLQSNWARPIIAMGQQSLPIFMLGTCLSFLGGVVLDGRQIDWLNSIWVNLAGIGIMLLSARLLNWLDGKPWKKAIQAGGLSANVDWPKQAMLAFSLLFLTIAPMMFLQSQPTDMTLAAAPTPEPDIAISGPEDLSEGADASETTEVAYQLPQKNPIELPEPL
ncbi:OpgC domain-containing protein [Methylomonas sp. SURF-2]|uniref:OpgC domain-containing protein n=1 Tax=Methylomonas subterranea TaxID=2952225 RepID=A0ABT1TKR2_9GAMM|nr:OpgC domain-containing protein [Methylomonas sp. SURF-2]MCQ8106061.1 OpgC domain-containing protein [Methylomonas sp. SURF-2]